MRNFKILFALIAIVLLSASSFYKMNKSKPSIHDSIKIGDLYQGGVIFYLDNEQRKGLIVALKDADYTLSAGCTAKAIFNSPYGGCSWAGSKKALATGALAQEIFTGEENTKKILKLHGIRSAFPAAYVANKYSTPKDPDNAYWYLPSQAELMQIWIVGCNSKTENGLSAINKTIKDNDGLILPCSDDKSAALLLPYWSSTEVAFKPANAWNVDLGFGSVNFHIKDSRKYGVRPVRSFYY